MQTLHTTNDKMANSAAEMQRSA